MTKLIVLASVVVAMVADTWGASLIEPWMCVVVPAAFAATWIAARLEPEFANASTWFACCLIPAGFIALRGGFATAEWSIWLAAVCGLILAAAPLPRWSLPAVWRLPLVFWALIVALTWPIVVLREANFRQAWTDATMVVWVATAALINMVGILWFDSLYAGFAADEAGTLDLERHVALPLGLGWVVAGCVGAYQMLGHIDFLNPGFWGVLGRATGTLNEANAFGVLSAMWGGVLAAVSRESGKRWHQFVGVGALLLSWTAVWASGSRSSILIVLLALAAIVFELCRRHGVRRTAVGLAIMAPLAALVAIPIVLARGEVIGPWARFVHDFSPSFSLEWVRQMGDKLWARGYYGPIAGLMIRSFPYAGVGAGGFHYVWPSFSWMVLRLGVPVDNAQNWYRHELAELGVIGSLGWIWWIASLGWVLVAARAIPGRQLTSSIIRTVLIGFGLISLVGVPGQEIAVAFTMWTLAFWFLRTITAPPAMDARPIAATAWVLVLAIVAGYTALTAFDARTILRPPVRAITADMDYSLGFYDAEGTIDGAAFRWAKRNALAVIPTPEPWLQLSVWVDHGDVAANPVEARVWRDGKRVMQVHLSSRAHETVYLRVPADEKRMILETSVSRAEYAREPGSQDGREHGLLVSWNPVRTLPVGAIVVD